MINIKEITDFDAPELDVYARLTEGQLLNRHEPDKGLFIAESPSRFHAVDNLGRELEEAGYTRLSEARTWALETGGKYYVTRNGSALIAFRIPKADFTG